MTKNCLTIELHGALQKGPPPPPKREGPNHEFEGTEVGDPAPDPDQPLHVFQWVSKYMKKLSGRTPPLRLTQLNPKFIKTRLILSNFLTNKWCTKPLVNIVLININDDLS